MTENAAPEGLGSRGRAFWDEVTSSYDVELDARITLAEACRTLDTLDALAAIVDTEGPMSTGSAGQSTVHPALAEHRAQTASLLALLKKLDLEDCRHRAAECCPASR